MNFDIIKNKTIADLIKMTEEHAEMEKSLEKYKTKYPLVKDVQLAEELLEELK